MTKRLKVMATAVFILPMCTGTASAFALENSADNKIPVIINYDGIPEILDTNEKTVGGLMASIDEFSEIEYELENVDEKTTLSSNMIVNVKAIREYITTKTEPIPYETIYEETDELELGKEQVYQEGGEGLLEIKIKERTSGGEIIYSEKIDEKIITNPINKIIQVGTKVIEEEPVNVIDGHKYVDAFNVKATAYTPYDPGCSGITASGTPARKGVIAVDPRKIPLGTKVYIPGYGVAVAEDTGGAIKGNKIDVCYNSRSDAFAWGVRNTTIYILED